MNISPQITSLPVVATTFNPATESLRRENNQREVITQPSPTAQSGAEKGVASERERARTPAQNNEQVDFASIRKRAEQENTTINDSRGEEKESSSESNQQEPSTEKDPSEVFAEEKQINDLRQRDQEVRSHELAHSSVGGSTTGAPSYSFEVGPDGKKYAVDGEVSVDLSGVSGNPRATIAKMQKVYAAALAPVNPSVQDNRVASSAVSVISQAQSQLLAAGNPQEGKGDATVTHVKTNEVFSREEALNTSDSRPSNDDFDTFINQTLESQESLSPTNSSPVNVSPANFSPEVASPIRTQETNDRALRIEDFYLKINQAYEKPPSYQFELTA